MNISINPIQQKTFTSKINTSNNRQNSCPAFGGNGYKRQEVKNIRLIKSISKKMKEFIIKSFFNPQTDKKLMYQYIARNINLFTRIPSQDKSYISNHNNNLAFIINILNIHSKNPDYANFVKDGIDFLQKNRNNPELYHTKDSVFGCPAMDSDGQDFVRTIWMAYEKAVNPESDIIDSKLKCDINKSRTYMNAY